MTTQLDPTFEGLIRRALPQLPADKPITPDLDLGAAGMASIATIDLLLRIEKTFAIKIPDDRLNSVTFATPASLWETIAEQLAQ